jgi:hypothetical protein
MIGMHLLMCPNHLLKGRDMKNVFFVFYGALCFCLSYFVQSSTSYAQPPAKIETQPNFEGQFESRDISSSGSWVLEFHKLNNQWSGRFRSAKGTWHPIEDVKVDSHHISFYINSKPVTKFRAKIDKSNQNISGTQEIGDGKKNEFNNLILDFSAKRL